MVELKEGRKNRHVFQLQKMKSWWWTPTSRKWDTTLTSILTSWQHPPRILLKTRRRTYWLRLKPRHSQSPDRYSRKQLGKTEILHFGDERLFTESHVTDLIMIVRCTFSPKGTDQHEGCPSPDVFAYIYLPPQLLRTSPGCGIGAPGSAGNQSCGGFKFALK